MPIDTKHPDYMSNSEKWKKCSIAVEGEDAVKEAGTLFLPKLSGQEEDDYNAYRDRASFYAAAARTLKGLTGIVFRKAPNIQDWPDEKADFLENVTSTGRDFANFSKHVFSKVVNTGRYGVLLEYAEKAEANALPYFAGYCAESIINWRIEVDEKGKEKLTMVVLAEVDEQEKSTDKYVLERKPQYRELLLEDGVYIQRVYKKKAGTGKDVFEQDGDDIIPKVRGRTLDRIPFVFYGPTTPSANIEKPPLLDIVNVNVSHYRTSADLEHGRHFTALPTPWAAGFKVGTALHIGSGKAWVSEDADAHCGFLEYTGQGLSALESALTQKEQQMAILGARMLEEPKSAVEATETHVIRRSGENSVLADLAEAVESGFNLLFKYISEISAFSRVPFVEINKDYDFKEVSPQKLTALLTVLQAGKMSFDTFFFNLQGGEVYPEGRTVEEELDLISKEAPTSLNGPGSVELEEEEEELEPEEEEEEEEED